MLRLPEPADTRWSAFNPSIAYSESEGYAMLIRSSNYWINQNNGQTVLTMGTQIMTRTWFAKLDENLEIISLQEVTFDHGNLFISRGVEDARLFWRDGWMFTAVMLEKGHTPRCRLAEYRLDEAGVAHFIQKLETPTPDRPEKNWMAPDMPTEAFDYIYSPQQTYKDGHLQAISDAPAVDARGSSGLLLQEDGTYLAVVHHADVNEFQVWEPNRFVHEKRSIRNYTHRFARFDANANLIELSDEFIFQSEGIEFAAGLVERGSDLVISYGKADIAAYLAVVSKANVLEILEPVRLTVEQSGT